MPAGPPRDVPARTAVVVAGAVVLVVETLAARLVAPYVGLTLESYTAAIGVALLGIALGARVGGTLSDRHLPAYVVAAGLLAGGALVLLVRPLVLLVGPVLPPGPVSSVVLVGVSTLPAVTVLSVVAPAAVKHRLRDLGTTGSVVGELSALGTLGALAGTFLTGYVLVATLPTSWVLGATGAACLLLGVAVAAAARAPRRPVAAGTGAGLACAGALALVGSPCGVETAYYCASVVEDPQREGGRVLLLDDLRHSYVDLDDPQHLEFAYVQRFADVVDAVHPGEEPLDAVHVGGGGFTLPRWLAATRPGTRSTVLELDEAVVELGRDRLAVGDIPGLDVVVGDGRVSLAALPEDSADLVVGDAFGSLSVPWHLATEEFLRDVRRVLRPDGVVVLNVIDYGPLAFLAAEARTLAEVFPHTALLARPDQLAGAGGNSVLVGSASELPLAGIEQRVAARGEPRSLVSGAAYDALAADAPLLTDDFAPVDQLLTPYRTR